MNSFWLTMLTVGILTFGIRLSFIVILDRWQPPELIQRSLRFVPVVVLTAIIVPELVMPGGTVDISISNLRLLAGIVAMLVAWKTKNIVWTIIAGMGVLLGLQLLI
ncbi:MAG: AzlD domain-containing protein [Anaerolineales bacterium]|uniref:AzlD domain-containing protein n=1 Tax=Candidatus Desulfolinea nitratireducens TaxID=2841698 RepID=A0A8J6THM0_9CHLR|nr:AzlD domain-containing protein [Candidatus Desulfolinea nitratireducens]MBL6961872.1 AzlD domain-containing protein [Anaerolineales bacterium]